MNTKFLAKAFKMTFLYLFTSLIIVTISNIIEDIYNIIFNTDYRYISYLFIAILSLFEVDWLERKEKEIWNKQ